MFIAIIVAFFSGLTRTVSRMVNAQLSAQIGPFQSTFYNYVLGLVCSGLILSLSRDPLPISTLTGGQIPAWAYWGGAVGVLFVVLSNLVTPKMSAFVMTLLIFGGQVATGLALDIWLQHQLSLGKIVGGVLILAGLLGNLSLDAGRRRAR